MSQQSPQQRAEAIESLDHGIDLVGWGIRADTVVVQASGLTTPITRPSATRTSKSPKSLLPTASTVFPCR